VTSFTLPTAMIALAKSVPAGSMGVLTIGQPTIVLGGCLMIF
jgi:hypothetical protein